MSSAWRESDKLTGGVKLTGWEPAWTTRLRMIRLFWHMTVSMAEMAGGVCGAFLSWESRRSWTGCSMLAREKYGRVIIVVRRGSITNEARSGSLDTGLPNSGSVLAASYELPETQNADILSTVQLA